MDEHVLWRHLGGASTLSLIETAALLSDMATAAAFTDEWELEKLLRRCQARVLAELGLREALEGQG